LGLPSRPDSLLGWGGGGGEDVVADGLEVDSA
jgi:hypothetical protein